LVYTNVHTPHAYRAATPSEVRTTTTDRTATGRSCARSVLFLVAWGDAGYTAAVKNALEGNPDAILYDVKTDIQATSALLGVYTRVCTVVTGKVGRL